eukprot:2198809-Prymnesium_polylepis.2
MDGEGGSVAKSKGAMEAELNLAVARLMAAFALEGVSGYPGPMTRERVEQALVHWREYREHTERVIAAAPDAALAACA